MRPTVVLMEVILNIEMEQSRDTNKCDPFNVAMEMVGSEDVPSYCDPDLEVDIASVSSKL